MLNEKFFFVTFGPIDVVLRSDELYFVFDSVDLFSATGTLLRLMIFLQLILFTILVFTKSYSKNKNLKNFVDNEKKNYFSVPYKTLLKFY